MQKLAHEAGGRNSLDWYDVERITGGRLGVTVQAPCPLCSHLRSTRVKQRSKCLGVQIRGDGYAVFNCLHCGAHGNVFRDAPTQVIDFAERQRQRDEARRRAEDDRQKRIRWALQLWHQGQPFRGSPAETYLQHGRNIGPWLDTFPYLDEVFGYHPSCTFGQNERHPAMLALVRDIRTDTPVALHRTTLKLGRHPERLGRKSLGPTGGGAIKISPDHEVHSGLLVGEGIETVLSASKRFQFKPVWSLIDKGNLSRFPVLPGIECVTVAVDNDASGDGQRAAAECIRRLVAAKVEVVSTQTNLHKDFNDCSPGAMQ
jgi:putative DNA primase/helicase